MTEVKASDNINVLLPENDTQELWELSGRVEAVKAYCRQRASKDDSAFDAMAILMMLENK